jgi:transposase
LDNGWSYKKIAEALFLDDQTIRNYEAAYIEGGIDSVFTYNYKDGATKLSKRQEQEQIDHLAVNTYQRTKEIVAHIQKKLWSTIPSIRFSLCITSTWFFLQKT